MPDDDPVRPVASSLPLVAGADGQPYLGCDAVIALLRAIAGACHANVHDPYTAAAFAAAVDQEADALECRAIAHTVRPSLP